MKYIKFVDNKKKGILWSGIRYLRYLISFLVVHYVPKRMSQKKYNVSACAIFKNEAVFLKEWVEYHRLIGVEHFYLYNNFSEDNYAEVLAPYLKEGVVDLIEWPIKYGQLSAYEDCYHKFKNETHWIAYIDLDEFICFRKEQSIQEWIKQFWKYPSIFINWKFFGTSGILEHDKSRLVIEQYTACWPHLVNSGKSIINTTYNFKLFTCHFFYPEVTIAGIKTMVLPVSEFKKFVHYWIFRSPFNAQSEVQINHYYTRSYQQHIYKNTVRGDACSQGSWENRPASDEKFRLQESRNIEKEYTIQRFLVLLKLKIGARQK